MNNSRDKGHSNGLYAKSARPRELAECFPARSIWNIQNTKRSVVGLEKFNQIVYFHKSFPRVFCNLFDESATRQFARRLRFAFLPC